MSARTYKLLGTSGGEPATLLVTHDFDRNGITLCATKGDYIDLAFRPYRELLGILICWVRMIDAAPSPGERVLVVDRYGHLHAAIYHESGVFMGTMGGRLEPAAVTAWALQPPVVIAT